MLPFLDLSYDFLVAQSFNEEFLGSVEASVVGLSYLFRSTNDSTGAQLKRLASYISRTRENSLGMLELVLRRNTNVPADTNAVSVLVRNPDDDSSEGKYCSDCSFMYYRWLYVLDMNFHSLYTFLCDRFCPTRLFASEYCKMGFSFVGYWLL